jgi:hypothetical protein
MGAVSGCLHSGLLCAALLVAGCPERSGFESLPARPGGLGDTCDAPSDCAADLDCFGGFCDSVEACPDPDCTLPIGPRLVITVALALDVATVGAGDTITGVVTYTNTGDASQPVNDLVIASRPPGGTHDGGPYMDFLPTAGVRTVAPGASHQQTASRTFAGTDPTGTWIVYPTWQDDNGIWHDGPEQTYEVVP